MMVKIRIEGETPRTREFEFADTLTEEEAITNALLALAPEEYSQWSAMYLFRDGLEVPRVIRKKRATTRGASSESPVAEDMELGDQGQSGG